MAKTFNPSPYVKQLLREAFDATSQPTAQLVALRELDALIEQTEQQTVFRMRNAGESWQAIADATKMNSRQAAQFRYQPARLLDKAFLVD